jgi:hypothetical protein
MNPKKKKTGTNSQKKLGNLTNRQKKEIVTNTVVKTQKKEEIVSKKSI